MEIKHSNEQLSIKNEFAIGREHFVVRAVAGSAKTYTSVLGLNAANSPRMLYCVFNKKMQLEAVSKITNPKVNVATYHSIGFKILLSYWRGVKANSYTEFGRVKEIEPSAPAIVHFQAAKLVSFLKNTFATLPTIADAMKTITERDIDTGKEIAWAGEKLAELAIKSIKLSLEYPKNKQISFEDMIFAPIVLGFVKPAYTLVVSDESQDLNAPQMAMLKALCEPKGRICVVGDPNQSIYNFRGTVFNSMEKFKLEFNAKEFSLPVSYRCPKKIVSLAQLLVPEIQAAPNAIDGEIVTMNNDSMLASVNVNEVILSRTNAPLAKNCLALLRKGKPAYIVGRDIAKQLISLIEGFETNDINVLYTKLDAWLTIKQANATLWNTNAVAYATDTHETIRAIAENCLDVEGLKNKINSLFMDSEFVRKPSVILSTVHKAKGLEWQTVYLLTESFSSGKRTLTPEQAQEERNIYYTAVTRSKNKLVNVGG